MGEVMKSSKKNKKIVQIICEIFNYKCQMWYIYMLNLQKSFMCTNVGLNIMLYFRQVNYVHFYGNEIIWNLTI